VPPGARSCSVTVAGYLGGPHQRSSCRGSLQTCQTRPIGASKRAVMVMVLASASLTTLITVIAVLPLSDARGLARGGRCARARALQDRRAGDGRSAASRHRRARAAPGRGGVLWQAPRAATPPRACARAGRSSESGGAG